MGEYRKYKCDKCGFTFVALEGIGMSFPMCYEETIEKIKSGQLGLQLKSFFEKHPDAAISIEYRTAKCLQCGNIENVHDYTMYLPKNKKEPNANEIKSSCIFPWDLKEYYEEKEKCNHHCSKCNGNMELLEERSCIKCPECGELMQCPLFETGFWD